MTSTASSPMALWRARLPWVMLAVTTALVLAEVLLSVGHEPLSDTVIYGAIALTVAAIGALVATRQPGNPIGWIFCLQGVGKAQTEAWGEGFTYHHLPTADVGRWVNTWIWLPDAAAYVLLFLLFPTGRLLSPRWRVVPMLLGVAVVLTMSSQSVNSHVADHPWQATSNTIDNVYSAGTFALLISLVAALGSLVTRYRHSAGLERLQLKLFVFAAAMTVPVAIVSVPLYQDSVLVESALGLAFLAVSLAAGLAILRYRLYDIDVVINRTLVYGALTAVLAAVYVGSVLILQLALESFTQGSGLAVAASTLGVAALFRPARARIQAAVDRRFFRSKYDAARTLDRFGTHLRDHVDLADIGTDLLNVVSETVQPSHASLWLRSAQVAP
jgi:hypothetical protein